MIGWFFFSSFLAFCCFAAFTGVFLVAIFSFPSAPAVSKQMLFIMQSARQTRARAAETVTYYKRVAYYLFVRTTDSSVSAPRLN